MYTHLRVITYTYLLVQIACKTKWFHLTFIHRINPTCSEQFCIFFVIDLDHASTQLTSHFVLNTSVGFVLRYLESTQDMNAPRFSAAFNTNRAALLSYQLR